MQEIVTENKEFVFKNEVFCCLSFFRKFLLLFPGIEPKPSSLCCGLFNFAVSMSVRTGFQMFKADYFVMYFIFATGEKYFKNTVEFLFLSFHRAFCSLFNYTHQHTHTHTHIYIYILFKKSKIYIRKFKTLLHVSITRSSSGSLYCSLLKL